MKKITSSRQPVKNRKSGENAPGAALTDHDVELIRVMHEEYPVGHSEHLGHRKLSKIFDVSRTAISNYVHYRKRIKDL